MDVFPSGWCSNFLPELDPLPSERIIIEDLSDEEIIEDLSEVDSSRELSLIWSKFVLDPFLVILLE